MAVSTEYPRGILYKGKISQMLVPQQRFYTRRNQMKTQQKRITARLGFNTGLLGDQRVGLCGGAGGGLPAIAHAPCRRGEPTAEMAEETEAGIDQLIGDAEAGAYVSILPGWSCHFNRDVGALMGDDLKATMASFTLPTSHPMRRRASAPPATKRSRTPSALGVAIPSRLRPRRGTLHHAPLFSTMADQDVADSSGLPAFPGAGGQRGTAL